MKTDPVEKTKEFLSIEQELEAELEACFADYPRKGLGFCHLYWSKKQDILWTKYGIRWRSPAEMNPDILFD